jgi:hypothetical protein
VTGGAGGGGAVTGDTVDGAVTGGTLAGASTCTTAGAGPAGLGAAEIGVAAGATRVGAGGGPVRAAAGELGRAVAAKVAGRGVVGVLVSAAAAVMVGAGLAGRELAAARSKTDCSNGAADPFSTMLETDGTAALGSTGADPAGAASDAPGASTGVFTAGVPVDGGLPPAATGGSGPLPPSSRICTPSRTRMEAAPAAAQASTRRETNAGRLDDPWS